MLRHISFIGLLLLVCVSCAKEESQATNIPYRRVEININTKIEHDFDNSFYSKKYYPNKGTVFYGGYVGVLVISNADASRLFAYELCCPNEAPEKNELQLTKSGIKLKCPKCKSEFNLADGRGKVESGPATQGLKRYSVIREGDLYRIRN